MIDAQTSHAKGPYTAFMFHKNTNVGHHVPQCTITAKIAWYSSEPQLVVRSKHGTEKIVTLKNAVNVYILYYEHANLMVNCTFKQGL